MAPSIGGVRSTKPRSTSAVTNTGELPYQCDRICSTEMPAFSFASTLKEDVQCSLLFLGDWLFLSRRMFKISLLMFKHRC